MFLVFFSFGDHPLENSAPTDLLSQNGMKILLFEGFDAKMTSFRCHFVGKEKGSRVAMSQSKPLWVW